MSALSTVEADRARRRITWSLVAGVGLGSTGNIAAGTVATIVAQEISGTTAFSGAPSASVVLGSALGSALLSALMVRRGRRAGLTTGYLVALVGAFLAVTAVVASSLPLLLVGTVLIGFGSSSNLLSRYTAADMYPTARRASAIATVVWGATIGAIVGPNLVGLAGPVAISLGLPELAGPYLVPAVFVGAAAILTFVMLRPEPYTLADRSESDRAGNGNGNDDRDGAARSLGELIRRPTVTISILVLLAGQVAMTTIMTMTPLHMTEHGHGLGAVGIVISGHVMGMYALSPITGRLTDRFGNSAVILAGLAILALAGVLAAVAPPEGGVGLFVALFLLGYGWNLGFVAGSAMLASGLDLADRTRLQGFTDALIWSSAAAAALTSGLVVAVASYTALGLIAAVIVVGPAWALIAGRRSLGTQSEGSVGA
jgi:MFS family permease